MDISSFSLSGTTFELRYPDAYALWDHAGRIWTDASRKFLNSKFSKAEPNVQSFEFGGRFRVDLSVGRMIIADHQPRTAPEAFHELTEHFFRELVERLEVVSLSRIGTRFTFVKEFSSNDEAADAVLSSGLLKKPQGKHMGFTGKVTMPEVAMRWEGDALGVHVVLKAGEKKAEIELPIGETDLKVQSVLKHRVIFDVDYYTLANTPIGQLHPRPWMEQAFHAVKRNSSFYLGRDSD